MDTAYAVIVLWLVSVGPSTAQEVIEVPGEDRWLEADSEELYRIGTKAGADWEQFGNAQTVAFDAAGRLYVFDSQIDWIFIVGTDGTPIRRIGRDGDGPGEFRNAADMAVTEDGRIVVPDLGHRALPSVRSEWRFRANGANGRRSIVRNRRGPYCPTRYRGGAHDAHRWWTVLYFDVPGDLRPHGRPDLALPMPLAARRDVTRAPVPRPITA